MTGRVVGSGVQAQAVRWPGLRMVRRCKAWAPAFGAAVLAVLILSGAAQAADWSTLYVDQHSASCSNSGPGTAAQPFCAIWAAVAKAGVGTTVVVASGTYHEQVAPRLNSETFTAAPGAHVVVTGSPAGHAGQHGFYLNGVNGITIKGFTIMTSSTGIYAVAISGPLMIDSNTITTGDKGIYVTSFPWNDLTSINIVKNRVIGCAHQGIELHNVSDRTGNEADVADNIVDHNSTGIYLQDSQSTYVSGNALAFNAYRGISLYRSDGQVSANVIHGSLQPIHTEYSSSGILGNVIFGSRAGATSPAGTGYAIDVYAGNSAMQATTWRTQIVDNSIAQYQPAAAVNIEGSSNTTLVDNVIDVLAPDGGTAVRVTPNSIPGTSLDYDVVDAPAGKLIRWGSESYARLPNFTAATGEETHGIQAPAGFTDPADGDLTLAPGSPAIDSAASGGFEAWNSPRFDDPATPNTGSGTPDYADRGAYEMRNTGFESDTAGWSTSGGSPGVTLTSVGGGHTGSRAAVLTNTATSPASCVLNDAPNLVTEVNAGTYTATMWVRADAPGATLKLRLREWIIPAPHTYVGEATTAVRLTTQWQPVTVQYTTTGDPIWPSTLDLNAWVSGAPHGTCFYADDASMALG